jgi:hypothetical protein
MRLTQRCYGISSKTVGELVAGAPNRHSVRVDDSASNISVREISDVNRGGIEHLTVTADQARYVASVSDSFSEAAANPQACPWYRAV